MLRPEEQRGSDRGTTEFQIILWRVFVIGVPLLRCVASSVCRFFGVPLLQRVCLIKSVLRSKTFISLVRNTLAVCPKRQRLALCQPNKKPFHQPRTCSVTAEVVISKFLIVQRLNFLKPPKSNLIVSADSVLPCAQELYQKLNQKLNQKLKSKVLI